MPLSPRIPLLAFAAGMETPISWLVGKCAASGSGSRRGFLSRLERALCSQSNHSHPLSRTYNGGRVLDQGRLEQCGFSFAADCIISHAEHPSRTGLLRLLLPEAWYTGGRVRESPFGKGKREQSAKFHLMGWHCPPDLSSSIPSWLLGRDASLQGGPADFPVFQLISIP
uniref:Uncharacterized protein n=1 Tax=Sphaerodactylus townsendi TaxID=933632 RepID=A0ACB8F2D7_9SAUR